MPLPLIVIMRFASVTVMPSEPTMDLESMDIAAVAATFATTSPSQEKSLSGVPAEPFFAVTLKFFWPLFDIVTVIGVIVFSPDTVGVPEEIDNIVSPSCPGLPSAPSKTVNVPSSTAGTSSLIIE